MRQAAPDRALRACYAITRAWAIRSLVTDAHRERVLAEHYDRLSRILSGFDREGDALEAASHATRHRVRSALAEYDLSRWQAWQF